MRKYFKLNILKFMIFIFKLLKALFDNMVNNLSEYNLTV
jgi:hypothetical protein